jgi:predicted RNase H-like nuclease (RuvC/YqgF family)
MEKDFAKHEATLMQLKSEQKQLQSRIEFAEFEKKTLEKEVQRLKERSSRSRYLHSLSTRLPERKRETGVIKYDMNL